MLTVWEQHSRATSPGDQRVSEGCTAVARRQRPGLAAHSRQEADGRGDQDTSHKEMKPSPTIPQLKAQSSRKLGGGERRPEKPQRGEEMIQWQRFHWVPGHQAGREGCLADEAWWLAGGGKDGTLALLCPTEWTLADLEDCPVVVWCLLLSL